MTKKAKICPVPQGAAVGYMWKWEDCSSPKISSSRSFEMYFDCLNDARLNGYEVELTHAIGATAPGGAAFRLFDRRTDEQA